MKVLITGICGFAGSVRARRIRESDPAIEVCGIDNLMRLGSETNRRFGRLGIKKFNGDIRSTTDVDGLPGDLTWIILDSGRASALWDWALNVKLSRFLKRLPIGTWTGSA